MRNLGDADLMSVQGGLVGHSHGGRVREHSEVPFIRVVIPFM